MLRPDVQARKARVALAIAGCISLLSLAACTQPATDTHADEEKTLRELDAQWSKTAAAKDLDATVAFYSDDAVVLPGDAPAANTKQTIRQVWAPLLAPDASVSWQVNQAEVARSGDLG